MGGGGEGGGVRSRSLGESSASFKLSTTKDSNDIYTVFLFCDHPPPRVSGSAPAMHCVYYAGRVETENPDSLGAVVGFMGETDNEGTVYLELPGSGTDRVKELSSTSNVGDPGVWMYRVDLSQIIGKLQDTSSLPV